MNKKDLMKRKKEIEMELSEINKHLAVIELSEKPYEAVIFGYSSPGRSSMFFKTEAQARKKFDEYSAKSYFRSGRVDGTVLYQYNPDGTRTVLDSVARGPWFKVPE